VVLVVAVAVAAAAGVAAVRGLDDDVRRDTAWSTFEDNGERAGHGADGAVDEDRTLAPGVLWPGGAGD
jgi:hypothetical protein